MTQREKTILALLFIIAVLVTIHWLVAPAYAACHKYSVWNYPYPQHCSIRYARREEAPPPPAKDIPLPSLENMEFPPDCITDWCQRLKGIGLLRQLRGTN